MQQNPKLIVMLTFDDRTVTDAGALFDSAKDAKAVYWGMKEAPLPFEEMQKIYQEMKRQGKTTVMEVVAYTEEECLKGAELAVRCACDMLMGTMFFDSVNDLCKAHGMKYMPFVGKVTERPSVLEGTVEDMIKEAKSYLEKGVYGVDLLAYRFTGDVDELIARFVAEVPAPVVIAGSIESDEQLDVMKTVNPWGFTIGGAFFEHKFGDDFKTQVDYVCTYLNR